MKLYICLTYYHSLITLIKCLIEKEKYDLLVANDIPGYDELKKQLEKTGRFNSVIEYDAINIRNRRKGRIDLVYYLNDKRTICKNIEKFCKIDFGDYSDIYLYHDIAEIGKYFTLKHIRYHLLEDALDYFKYFDKYYTVNKGTYDKKTLKFKIKKIFGIGYKCWGSSDSCIDIEVNDINEIKIPKDKCIEVPRKELFAQLTNEDKVMVFNTFAAGKTINGTLGKTVIVCTQPLFPDHFVDSIEDQLRVFECIVDEYCKKGFQVVIKPHPRDNADYTGIVKRFSCDFIDKNLPSEILNFNPDAKYDVAVSVTSTAINFLEYAVEKRFMGREYIAEVLKNER